jgi:hypothetical protein
VNVYPCKPLKAQRLAVGWSVEGEWFNGAEFAAHFYPAELLDRLIDACGRLAAMAEDHPSTEPVIDEIIITFNGLTRRWVGCDR